MPTNTVTNPSDAAASRAPKRSPQAAPKSPGTPMPAQPEDDRGGSEGRQAVRQREDDGRTRPPEYEDNGQGPAAADAVRHPSPQHIRTRSAGPHDQKQVAGRVGAVAKVAVSRFWKKVKNSRKAKP